jgi:peroxiredoxin
MHHLKPLFHRKSFLALIPQTHLPGFVEQAAALKSKGVQEVACISINDAFVMAAWGKEHGAGGKVQNAV